MIKNGSIIFLKSLKTQMPHYAASVDKLARSNPSFKLIGDRLVNIVAKTHPDQWIEKLIDGYGYFVSDVIRSQTIYEKTGSYERKKQKNILNELYLAKELMGDYHWGMLATLFCWSHHLMLVNSFLSRFVPYFDKKGPKNIIDLGCGSGVWSILAMEEWENTEAEFVDISPFSLSETKLTIDALSLNDRISLHESELTRFESSNSRVDAIISTFVAAHLENPQTYFDKISSLLKNHGLAYISIALNAAEIDHIFEFNKESEPIIMAEKAGLTLIDAQLACSDIKKLNSARSFAMIFRKR